MEFDLAIIIQRFSGFISSPNGWLKSRKAGCDLSMDLYMILAPFNEISWVSAR